MFFRVKSAGSYQYLQIVHSIREGEKVRQQVFGTLGRLDVLPVTDYGLRSAVRNAYGLEELPDKEELVELGERWRPYRSIATWYMWRSL